jgi:hypothetical protein
MIIEGQILPIGRVEYLQDVKGNPVQLDLSDPARVAAIVESMTAHIASVRPPLLLEHLRDGLRRGEVLAVFIGTDPDTGAEGIRVRIRVDDPELAKDAGLIRRLSPFLVTNTQASDGTIYPYGLHEVSAVSVPMSDADQPDVLIAAASQIEGLREASQCAILAQTVEHSAILAQQPENEPMTMAEILAAMQAATPEELAAFKAFVAPAAPPAPDPVVEIESADPAPTEDPMLIAMSKRIDSFGKVMAKLERALDTSPSLPVGQVAVAAGRGVANGVGGAPDAPDVIARASQIQREKNVSFPAAHRLALREVSR